MPVSVPEIISKLVDNANLGKVVTDVGAGFALSFPALMLIGMQTGMSVVPIDRLKEIDAAITAQAVTVGEQMRGLCVFAVAGQQATAGCPLGQYDPLNVRLEGSDGGESRQNIHVDRPTVYFWARQEIASLAAQLEGVDARIAQRVQQNTAPDAADADRRDALASNMDRLITHRDSADEEVQRLESLINEYDDARSLEFNFEALGKHITEILAISVVLGVLLSQINRLVWVQWIYEKILRWQRPDLADKVERTAAFAVLEGEERQSLVSDYYRYMEGAINMIIPVLAFGLVFPRYVNERITPDEPLSTGLFLLVSVVIAFGLVLTGYFTYRTFRERELASAAPAVQAFRAQQAAKPAA